MNQVFMNPVERFLPGVDNPPCQPPIGPAKTQREAPMFKTSMATASVAAFAIAAFGVPVAAKAAEFYAGKTINMTIGFGFGGTYGS